MAEQIEQSDVASLLAKAQALTPTEGSNKPVQNSPTITPEEAFKLAEKHENKTVNSVGQEIFKEEQTEVTVEPEEVKTDDAPDLTGLSIDEQIKVLNEYKAKQEAIENPLASVEKKAEEAGIDGEQYVKEYIQNGELSEESYKSLEKAGFDKVAIDAYIEAREIKSEKLVNKAIADVCGTKEAFSEMSNWMIDNLTQQELDRYNAGIQTDNYLLHLENMFLKYQSNKPKSVRTLRADGSQVRVTSDTEGYKSQGEVVIAMQDPRYKSDAEYRKTVQRKVALMK